MMIQKFNSYEELSKAAADFVFQRIVNGLSEKNKFNLCLPTGSTPEGMYKELLKLFEEKPNLDLTNFHTVNLDEYYPMKRSNPHSYYNFMMNNFWGPLSQTHKTFLIENNAHIPNGETNNPEKEGETYEQVIVNLGGIDLAVLGVGINGHIGFNEPGSDPDSRTRMIELTDETRQANSRFYNSFPEVPTLALTMGIATIMDSREILLLIAGEGKRNVLEELIKNEVKPAIPATLLLYHKQLNIFSSI
ncbi:MAG: glucosamine-6-phosphate deaminase [Candidatus Roizmanbacteria bacterium]|nr:glucosamine-6-phosphate deaminase [Candidatus Roizmanbacteria bacterium]